MDEIRKKLAEVSNLALSKGLEIFITYDSFVVKFKNDTKNIGKLCESIHIEHISSFITNTTISQDDYPLNINNLEHYINSRY